MNIAKERNLSKKKLNYVQWNITRTCNYNCSYCLTRRKRLDKEEGNISSDPLPFNFLNKFTRNLYGQWRFFICGTGEPFMAPGFLKIIEKLIKNKHEIGVMTNFSASENKILEFCKITKNRLFEFGVSLHLEHIELDKFLRKAILIKRLIGDKFHVHSVARKGQVFKIEKIAQTFRREGIQFILQLERDYIKKSVQNPFVDYTRQEKEIIKKFRGRFYNKNILKFKGRLCWTGSKYFVVDEKGDVYRCNPAQRSKDKRGYLGNLLKGTFKLRNKPTICCYDYCYCVRPILDDLILDKK